MIAEIVGFTGELDYDHSKPDGTLSKLMDSSRINQLGWSPNTSLRDGIKKSYQYFLTEINE